MSGLQGGNRNAPKWGKAICKEADVKFYAEVFSMPLAGGVLLREKAIEKAAGVMEDAAVDAVKAPRTGASQSLRPSHPGSTTNSDTGTLFSEQPKSADETKPRQAVTPHRNEVP